MAARRARHGLVAVLATAVVVAGCGSDGGDEDGSSPPDESSTTTTGAAPSSTTSSTAAPSSTTTTEPAPEPLVILVTNDDGVGAPGIDALVDALAGAPDVELVVVAPAENQSGSGDMTTPEGVTPTETTTAGGFPAVAVSGRPADAVNYALDTVFADQPPDLVVSGINEGQNLGPIVPLSGTVGAARTAARRGIPALAVSQGIGPEGVEADFPAGVGAALDWLADNRDALVDGTVASLNVPTCTAGEIRGVAEVTRAADEADGGAIVPADCTSTLADPMTDIAAFNAGFIALTDPGLEG